MCVYVVIRVGRSPKRPKRVLFNFENRPPPRTTFGAGRIYACDANGTLPPRKLLVRSPPLTRSTTVTVVNTNRARVLFSCAAVDTRRMFLQETFAHGSVLLVVGKRQGRKVPGKRQVAVIRVAMGTRMEVGDHVGRKRFGRRRECEVSISIDSRDPSATNNSELSSRGLSRRKARGEATVDFDL